MDAVGQSILTGLPAEVVSGVVERVPRNAEGHVKPVGTVTIAKICQDEVRGG